MDTEELEEGMRRLHALALAEYHQELAQVAFDSDEQHAAARLGRLVGVMLKEPFATPREVDSPSYRTGAYRAWDLVMSPEDFQTPQRVATWQYGTLEALRLELTAEHPYLADWSAYRFAVEAQREKGFFGYFAQAIRRYICGDPVVRARLREAIEEARKGGVSVSETNPEVLVASSGAALGAYMVDIVPILGFVGVPVLAALVLILYRLGVEGFCGWSNSLRTDEDEKH